MHLCKSNPATCIKLKPELFKDFTKFAALIALAPLGGK